MLTLHARALLTLTAVASITACAPSPDDSSADPGGGDEPIAEVSEQLVTATAPMLNHHSETGAFQLSNGKVLVAGGNGPPIGITRIPFPTVKTDLYDLAAGQWTAGQDTLGYHAPGTGVALNDGRILMVGYTLPETYNPSTGSWAYTAAPVLPGRRAIALVSLADGRALAIGGIYSSTAVASAEIYDPVADTWTATGSMNAARAMATAVRLQNGKVLVVGGHSGSAILNSCESYDPATGLWASAYCPPVVRARSTLTLLADGRALLAGGDNGAASGTTTAAYIFDPATGLWSTTGSMAHARSAHAAALLPNGKVVVAGGMWASGYRSSIEVYDPATGTWSSGGNMSVGRHFLAATTLSNGSVLLAGGRGNLEQLYKTVDIYTP